MRGEDDGLRAFFNVCRHRGSRLVEEASGTLRGAIACPYHAWTYALDGQFKRAPRYETEASRAGELALTSMPLAARDGLVFVALDPSAASLAESLTELPDLARFRLHALKPLAAVSTTRSPPTGSSSARTTASAITVRRCTRSSIASPISRAAASKQAACFNGGPMRLRAGFETLSMSGHGDRAALVRDGATTMRAWSTTISSIRISCSGFILTI